MDFLLLALRMYDLKLSGLFPIADWAALRARTYKSTGCIEAVSAYRENINLMNTMAMVPGYSFMNGENWGISVVRAMNELGSQNPDDPAVGLLASKIFDEYDIPPDNDGSKRKHFFEANSNAEKIASLPGRTLSHGALHGLLKSLVIQAWTAFEILSEDLWTLTTKQRPELENNITKKEWRECGFRSIKKLRTLYAYTFRIDSSSIQSAMTDSSVEALSLLRNVLVHLGGKTDSEFISRGTGIAVLSQFARFHSVRRLR